MTYHAFSECTLNNEERRAEARKIVEILTTEGIFNNPALLDSERKFLSRIGNEVYVSVKQLFWLRDIKDKYL